MPFIFTTDIKGYLDNALKETVYDVQGGTTNGTQPTFNGTPLFSASYVLSGELVHFRINVDFDNITSFGTGQYYMTIPFNSKYDAYFRNGNLLDASTNKKYSISGHVSEGSNMMYLLTTVSNGNEEAFTHSVPFNLAIQDDFHISGSYIRSN